MKFLGFDPGATVRFNKEEGLAELTLSRLDDGRLRLDGETDDGRGLAIMLRADFLDEFVAQARASEQSAA